MCHPVCDKSLNVKNVTVLNLSNLKRPFPPRQPRALLLARLRLRLPGHVRLPAAPGRGPRAGRQEHGADAGPGADRHPAGAAGK